MKIHTLNSSSIAQGERSFRDCLWQYLGNDYAHRETGQAVIPGAIVAALRNGFSWEDDICRIVARVSHCEKRTVRKILRALADEELAGRMWEEHEAGQFRLKKKAGRLPAICIMH